MARLQRKRLLSNLEGMTVILISEHAGILQKQFRLKFHHLKTLHSYNLDDEPGTTLCKTITSLTAPGEIYLIGLKENIEKDYIEIRYIEKTLYQDATRNTVEAPNRNLFNVEIESHNKELTQEVN